MSWDLFAMDLPDGVRSIEEVPHDWEGGDLGPRSALIAHILEVVPDADFSDPSWGRVETPGGSIELGLGDAPRVRCLAFHVRGGGDAAEVVDRILRHLGVRAVDGSTGELFSLDGGRESFTAFQSFRDGVLDRDE